MVDVVVLPIRTQLQLVRAEIQPAVQDSSAVGMLDHSVADQRVDDIALCWNGSRTTGWNTIYSYFNGVLLGIHELNRILFAGKNVYSSLVIGSEPGLLGSALAWELDRGQHFVIRETGVYDNLLRDVIEASRGQDASIEVSACERDAVCARCAIADLSSVPAIDEVAVVRSDVLVVCFNDVCVCEALHGTSVVEVNGHNRGLRA